MGASNRFRTLHIGRVGEVGQVWSQASQCISLPAGHRASNRVGTIAQLLYHCLNTVSRFRRHIRPPIDNAGNRLVGDSRQGRNVTQRRMLCPRSGHLSKQEEETLLPVT
jgi:hypothetical protein